MRTNAGLVTRYRVRWLTIVVAFVGVLVWLVVNHSSSPVDADDVKSAVKEANPPPQTIKQQAGPLNINTENLELSLSSGDGSLVMRIWAGSARKIGSRYEISNGAMQFVTDESDTVLLQLEDAVYTQDEGVARIEGSIIGHISGSEHYFDARSVEWDITGNLLEAAAVTFRSPIFEVTGDEMPLLAALFLAPEVERRQLFLIPAPVHDVPPFAAAKRPAAVEQSAGRSSLLLAVR